MMHPVQKAAWLGFAALIATNLLQGLWAALHAQEAVPLTTYSSAVVSTLACVGITGYALDRRIWFPLVWRALAFVLLFGLVTSSFALLMAPTWEHFAKVLLSVLLSGPMIYGLFRYASSGPRLWPEAPIPERFSLMEQAIERGTRYEASKVDQKNVTHPNVHVTLFRDEHGIAVRIARSNTQDEKTFLNHFDTLAPALAFVLANTPAQESDLVEIYQINVTPDALQAGP